MRAGRAPARSGAPASTLQDLADAALRFVERFLRLLLADQRRLDRGGHGLADRWPLRHLRTPLDIEIAAHRLDRGLQEVRPEALGQARELLRLPEREPVQSEPLHGAARLPRRTRLRLGRGRPADE